MNDWTVHTTSIDNSGKLMASVQRALGKRRSRALSVAVTVVAPVGPGQRPRVVFGLEERENGRPIVTDDAVLAKLSRSFRSLLSFHGSSASDEVHLQGWTRGVAGPSRVFSLYDLPLMARGLGFDAETLVAFADFGVSGGRLSGRATVALDGSEDLPTLTLPQPYVMDVARIVAERVGPPGGSPVDIDVVGTLLNTAWKAQGIDNEGAMEIARSYGLDALVRRIDGARSYLWP